MRTTVEQTSKEQIEARINAAQERYDQLYDEACELPGLLHEAQERADMRRAAALMRRADKELPSELAHAKADKLDAMADLEALGAGESDELAEPYTAQVTAIEQKIEQLQSDRSEVRNVRDGYWQAAKMHKLRATELRHEAKRLRDIHDPAMQEALA